MTYILNAVVADDGDSGPLRAGDLIADLDEPQSAVLRVGPLSIAGTRYLIVLEDARGYRSSMNLVRVPHAAGSPTVVSVPPRMTADLEGLLRKLWSRSGAGVLAVYLEANRVISHPPEKDDVPPDVKVFRHTALDDLLHVISRGEFREEEIHAVGG